MPADREGQDDHPGGEMADFPYQRSPGLLGVLEMGVGQAGVPPLGDTKDLGRLRRFLGPQRRAAPGAGLSGGQVENAGAVAGIRGFQQGAGAGELDVVAVRGDGENVHGHARSG